jgi:acyl-coenzyme A synthetase/AMP-(fatty) acid ligase
MTTLLGWQARTMPLEGQRILQYASPAFDVSIQELFSGLMGHNTLVVVRSTMRRDFVALAHLVRDQQIECVFAPDTAIKALLTAATACGLDLASVRAIVSAGEAVVIDGEQRQFALERGTLYNHYGPSETHVVTAAAIPRAACTVGARPSIGRAIDATEILILDRWLRCVPPGTFGELYIASASVARGYHRAPRLTAERFMPNPFPSTRAGTRVFRTGDLACFDGQGDILFHGRADTQVKLRGFRIELDEIRQVLLQHPQVKDAVVTVLTRQSEPELCAYIVTDGEVASGAIRERAARTLPAYMVPATIAFVPAIPATRNGKIDYARLMAASPPAPVAAPTGDGPTEAGATGDAPAREAPSGGVEARLLEIWREVLGQAAPIARDDDFLQIGGSSLSLLQLQLKIRARFALPVSLGTLVAHSSFARMSGYLEEALSRQLPAAEGTGALR